MKLTTSILVLMMTGSAWAQSPNIIQNTQDKLNAVQQQKTAASNAALGVSSTANAKPAPSVPVTGAKPAPSKPVATKPAAAPQPQVAKPAAAQAQMAKPGAAPVVITKPASPAAAPKAGTQAAVPAGPKVIPGQKIVAVPAPASANAASPATGKNTGSAKASDAKPGAKTVAVIVPNAAKTDLKAPAKPSAQAQIAAPAKPAEKKYAMTGKRDPFLSPVVSHMGGSGCNTGKKCLEIGQVNLKGVIKSDAGMIAVVTNSVNKAYFLRENDPVFNGYVEKITGDSITFKETFQDKLGKSFTRDVVKKILTPAV